MIKKELEKLRPLLATRKMMKIAADDIPHTDPKVYWKKVVYQHGLYLRCFVQNGTLKVSFFFTELLRSGGRNPAYELYIEHEKSRFVTYDRLHDKWLNSKLDMLPWPDYVRWSDKVWINPSDYETVKKYLGGQKGGYDGLLEYQRHIRDEELKRRHKRETDKWDEDLAQVPPLPKDWARWVDKVGIPDNYIFYQYSRKGAETGYCSFCEKEVPIQHPRHNKQKTCPCCRHKVAFKSIGKAGTVVTEKRPMYLIQRCKDGFIVREFYGYRKYPRGEYTAPECYYYLEIRRSFYDRNGKALRAYFWGLYKLREMRWIPAAVCYAGYGDHDEGRVYGKTLPHLAKNELSRTGLPETLAIDRMIDPEKYLAVLQAVPQMEKIAKANLPCLVHECISGYYNFCEDVHDMEANSLTEMLGINTQELKRLRQNDGGLRFLDWLKFERATGRIVDDNVLKWLCSEKIEPDDIRFIQSKMSVLQIHNYIRRQMSVYKKKSRDVITTWADYLSMAKRLKLDTDDEIIFRVNKLYQRHDELVERCHDKPLAIQAGQIAENYPHVDEICVSIKDKYEFIDSTYTVIVPACIEDIILEGRNLNHCVADSERYWERIERRETYVLFLRRSSDVSKSYYTLEIEPNGTIRQKRTMFDRQEPDIEDATKFLAKWQKVVTKRLTTEDRKLAEKSRTARLVQYEQLRNDRVIIHTGALAGKLLVDVLLADLMENAA